MPRYFFETDDGVNRYRDRIGHDVPNLAAAQDMALEHLPNMARNTSGRHGCPWMLIVNIRDEEWQIVYTASLSLMAQHLGQPASPCDAVPSGYTLNVSGQAIAP